MSTKVLRAAKTTGGAVTSHAVAGSILGNTRMCKFFATHGRCPRGTSCTFAHGEAELRPQPDLQKTRLCEEFLRRGCCKAGEACRFAHGSEERRRIAVQRTPPKTNGSDAPVRSGHSHHQLQEQQRRGGEQLWQLQQHKTSHRRQSKQTQVDIEGLRSEVAALKAQLSSMQARAHQPHGRSEKGWDGCDSSAMGAVDGPRCVSTHDTIASLRTTLSEDSLERFSWADACGESDARDDASESQVSQMQDHNGKGNGDHEESFMCDLVIKNTFVTLVPTAPAAPRSRAHSAPPCCRDLRLRDTKSW